ncbi:MAG: GAF domain-containing protein [Cyanobacteria bacterium P01_E01_bin.42]
MSHKEQEVQFNDALHKSQAIDETRTSIVGFKPKEEEQQEQEIKQELQKQVEELSLDLLEDEVRLKQLQSSIEFYNSRSQTRNSIIGLKLGSSNPPHIDKVKKDIINHALKITYEKIECKVVTLFLFSKDGLLERAGLYGLNTDANLVIDNDELDSEIYGINQKNIISRVVKPFSESKFGELQFISDISKAELSDREKQRYEQYEQKFGILTSEIAIPLNGRNKTYRVLRIFSKEKGFSKEDILSLNVTGYIATALSNFRRDVQIEMFKYLSKVLMLAVDIKMVCKQVAEMLVLNPETAFKACIIRVKNNYDRNFHVETFSRLDTVTDNRDDNPVKETDKRLLSKVIQAKKLVVIQKIQEPENLIKFRNQDWICENNFESFGCFPLVVKDEIIGTLSPYTGYNYDFHPDIIDLVESITSLLAMFIYRVKKENSSYMREDSLNAKDARWLSLTSYNSLSRITQ